MQVRRATLNDLNDLVHFTLEEARESEGIHQLSATLEKGIRMALENESLALYWLLVDEHNIPQGSASAVREWSDWNAGYYWWIQSMYIAPAARGQGHMRLLINAIREEMAWQNGLELRLYVHTNNHAAKKAYLKAGFSQSTYEIMIFK